MSADAAREFVDANVLVHAFDPLSPCERHSARSAAGGQRTTSDRSCEASSSPATST